MHAPLEAGRIHHGVLAAALVVEILARELNLFLVAFLSSLLPLAALVLVLLANCLGWATHWLRIFYVRVLDSGLVLMMLCFLIAEVAIVPVRRRSNLPGLSLGMR